MAELYTKRGIFYSETGKNSKALESYKEAIAVRRTLVGEHPEFLALLAQSLTALGNLQKNLGQYESALKTFEKSVDIQDSLMVPGLAELRNDLAMDLNNVGAMETALQNFGGADEALTKGINIQTPLVDQQPKVGNYRGMLSMLYRSLATLRSYENRRKEALGNIDLAIPLLEDLTRSDQRPKYRNNLAAAYETRALKLKALKRYGESREWFQRAIEKQENLTEEFPEILDYWNKLATSCFNFGILESVDGTLGKAIKLCKKAVGIWTKIVPGYPECQGHLDTATRVLHSLEAKHSTNTF